MRVNFYIHIAGAPHPRDPVHQIAVEVAYTLSPARIEQGRHLHNVRVAQEQRRNATWLREGGGHAGSGVLGNQMMNAAHRIEQEAAALAAKHLGVDAVPLGGTGQVVWVKDQTAADVLAQHLRNADVAVVLS